MEQMVQMELMAYKDHKDQKALRDHRALKEIQVLLARMA